MFAITHVSGRTIAANVAFAAVFLAGCQLCLARPVGLNVGGHACTFDPDVGVAFVGECNGPDGFSFGGGAFTQRSARTVFVDNGNPSDLILTNFRIVSTVLNAGPSAYPVLTASGYEFPSLVYAAAHMFSGSVTLLGPIGAFATISVNGAIDGVFTPGPTITVTKNEDREQFAFASPKIVTAFDPPIARPAGGHTRTASYTFAFGGGALAGSEIRFPSTGENPFWAPEPGTLGLCAAGVALLATSVARRRQRSRR